MYKVERVVPGGTTMRVYGRESEWRKQRSSKGDSEGSIHPQNLRVSRNLRVVPDIRRMGRH
jgi:hypothetical protein